jgi:mono/diheme cytochrome c family protein
MVHKNKRGMIAVVLFCAAFTALLALAAVGQARLSQTKPQGDVARGKYLVEEVAKCSECHTPRDANGNLDPHAYLLGAPIWIMPVKHIANWADRAPALAGLPSFTERQMENVLEKGTGPEGEVLRPPMHIYHMSDADAKAIIAYLNSLPVKKH